MTKRISPIPGHSEHFRIPADVVALGFSPSLAPLKALVRDGQWVFKATPPGGFNSTSHNSFEWQTSFICKSAGALQFQLLTSFYIFFPKGRGVRVYVAVLFR